MSDSLRSFAMTPFLERLDLPVEIFLRDGDESLQAGFECRERIWRLRGMLIILPLGLLHEAHFLQMGEKPRGSWSGSRLGLAASGQWLTR